MENKTCGKCGIAKENIEFYKDATKKDGLCRTCKDCSKEQHKIWCQTHQRKRKPSKQKNKDWRKRSLRRKFGMTRDDYDDLLKSQSGKCAICGSETSRRENSSFCIDHSHDNGLVRGLLCHLCNRGLGFFQDDASLLLKASDYLQKGGVVVPKFKGPIKGQESGNPEAV
jgi:hypothetical protein